MRIWAFSANYSCLQGICCHFWPNLSPGAALGYLRNGALDRKTFLVKVGWYEVYKTHIEFGAIPRDEGAKFGSLLKPVHLNMLLNDKTPSNSLKNSFKVMFEVNYRIFMKIYKF